MRHALTLLPKVRIDDDIGGGSIHGKPFREGALGG